MNIKSLQTMKGQFQTKIMIMQSKRNRFDMHPIRKHNSATILNL